MPKRPVSTTPAATPAANDTDAAARWAVNRLAKHLAHHCFGPTAE